MRMRKTEEMVWGTFRLFFFVYFSQSVSVNVVVDPLLGGKIFSLTLVPSSFPKCAIWRHVGCVSPFSTLIRLECRAHFPTGSNNTNPHFNKPIIICPNSPAPVAAAGFTGEFYALPCAFSSVPISSSTLVQLVTTIPCVSLRPLGVVAVSAEQKIFVRIPFIPAQ